MDYDSRSTRPRIRRISVGVYGVDKFSTVLDKLKEYSNFPTSLTVCHRNLTLQFQNSCLENFAKSSSDGNVSMGSFLLQGYISESLHGEMTN